MEAEEIKKAVKDALREEMKDFYIDRETHYKQHEFIGSMMDFVDQCKGVVLKTVVTIIIGGAIGLMILGFAIKHGK